MLVGCLGVCLGVVAFCWNNPFAPRSILFVSVSDAASDWRFATDEVFREVDSTSVPEFIILEGKLLLNIQTTHPTLLLVTTVRFHDWGAENIQRLRDEHPELESYWPDPEREDGGVRWSQSYDQ